MTASLTHSPTSPLSTAIERVRAFNRFYTPVIGVLSDGYLDTPYTLTESRVLYELDHNDASEILRLREALDLDPGFLSRVLTKLEADGLVTRQRSTRDGRSRVITLTERGREVRELLDRRAVERVGGLLSGLDDTTRQRLLAALETVRDIVGGERPASTVSLRAPEAGDLGWVVERNAAIYAHEYGWDSGYEALVARIVADYLEHRDPARDAMWIAELDGRRVGAVFCVHQDAEVAKLRLLLVEPDARGMGVGRALVEECLRFARAAGYTRMTLWTNSVLTAARRIYARVGFELVASEPHHSFGQDLVGETWERDLSAP